MRDFLQAKLVGLVMKDEAQRTLHKERFPYQQERLKGLFSK